MSLRRLIKNRFLRILVRTVIGLFIFFGLLVLFIRSPWGQGIIVSRVVSFITAKTDTKVSIDRLYLTFSGNLSLQGLYMEDEKQDTLVYSKDLEVSVALLPLIKGDKINVKSVEWNGLKAKIYRPENGHDFNYSFLIEAFIPTDTTTAAPLARDRPEIVIGKISLSNIDLSYNDEVTGIKAKTIVGQLELYLQAIDIEQMVYKIDEMSMANSNISYQLSKAPNTDSSQDNGTATDPLPLPMLSVAVLVLDNVSFNYEVIPDRIKAQVDIGNCRLELPQADLKTQKIILQEFVLNDSRIFFKQITSPQSETATDSTLISNPVPFLWPDWEVEINRISLSDNRFIYQSTDRLPKEKTFDPNWLAMGNLNFEASDIMYKPEKAKLTIDGFSFSERSGFALRKIAFDLKLNSESLRVESLDFTTEQNQISGDIQLEYASLSELMSSPDATFISANLNQFKINLLEASVFNSVLTQNEYIQTLSKKMLTGRLNIEGQLSDLELSEFVVNWGKQTKVNLAGSVSNTFDLGRIKIDLPTITVLSTKNDITQIIDLTSLGLTLPEKLALTGSFNGGLNEAITNLKLKTTSGSLEVKGQFSQNETLSFEARMEGKQIQLGELLQNEQLDTLTFSIDLDGEGTSLNDLSAKLSTDFEQLKYDGYDFSNLNLSAEFKKGKGGIDLQFKDQNLDVLMTTNLELDSIAPKMNTQITLKGADLFALGLTTENIKTAFVLNASFEGNATAFNLKAQLNDGIAIYEQEAYTFGNFDLKAKSQPDTLNVVINSQIIDSKIVANKGLFEILPLLENEFNSYFNGTIATDNEPLSTNTKVKVRVVARQSPVISEVFLQGLERMDSIAFNLDFDGNGNKLMAEFMAPYINYQGTEIDSLGLKLSGEKAQVNFLLGWSSINSGSVSIDKTQLEGKLDRGLVTSRFNIMNNKETLLNIGSEVKLKGDTIQVHVLADRLIFNSEQWNVPEENKLLFVDNSFKINDFELSNGTQKVMLGTSLPGEEVEHIGAVFSGFQLSTITSLLNAEKPPITGELNGDVIVENPSGSYGLVADLTISDLIGFEVPFGQLKLNAESTGIQKYTTELSLSGENANLALKGSYIAQASGGDLTLNFDLKNLKMKVIEAFSNTALSESSGSLSAEVMLTGNTNALQYSGTLGFSQVSFLVNELNSRFSIANEQLNVNNSGLFLDEFVIADGDNNDFSLDGQILTEQLTNPSFDLKLKANNFGIVNSTKGDSDLFYGQMNMDADLIITGDLNTPKVRGNLKVIDGSVLTFIVPESQLDLKERNGVVLFVNRENPDDILTAANQSVVASATIAGYDIETIFAIGDNSEFNIIIDEATGDNLRVTGDGDFILAVEPSGRIALSGKYELSGGHYEANLFNLVKRRFEIAPGSTISWTGDPYSAELDVSAIYNIKTSAGALMATRTSAEATGLETSYQQRLPFQVYINVEGELLTPEISFNLDMPEDDRGMLSGTVYSQVQQLNSQEEELNKQVFSLLVLSRFFPNAGSDGSSGGPASLALDNVNSVLSGQLNNYSKKIFGNTGVDVGFNLNSSTGGQNNGGLLQSQLGITAKREFFNDRLIIQVGSEVNVAGGQNSAQGAPIIGNVSLEYLLTEDKRLRLQGFSRNEYEGLVDGQLTVSGIALVFTREFNKFKELFAKQLKEEVEKNEKDTKEK